MVIIFHKNIFVIYKKNKSASHKKAVVGNGI